MSVLEKSLQLPNGHYDRKMAALFLQNEYAACKRIELKFKNSLPHHLRVLDHETAMALCTFICNEWGGKKLRRITVNQAMPDIYYAQYRQYEIAFKRSRIDTHILIHELTHHFGYYRHDERFCEVLQILVDTAKEFFKNRSAA